MIEILIRFVANDRGVARRDTRGHASGVVGISLVAAGAAGVTTPSRRVCF